MLEVLIVAEYIMSLFIISFLEITSSSSKTQIIICPSSLVTVAEYVSLMLRKIIISIVQFDSYQKSPYNLSTNLKGRKFKKTEFPCPHFMLSLMEGELQSHQFLLKVCIYPASMHFRDVAFLSLWLSLCVKDDPVNMCFAGLMRCPRQILTAS